jgi:hypothetical protein
VYFMTLDSSLGQIASKERGLRFRRTQAADVGKETGRTGEVRPG